MFGHLLRGEHYWCLESGDVLGRIIWWSMIQLSISQSRDSVQCYSPSLIFKAWCFACDHLFVFICIFVLSFALFGDIFENNLLFYIHTKSKGIMVWVMTRGNWGSVCWEARGVSAASGGSLGRDLPREDGFISTSISHGLHWMDFAPNQDFFKSLSCFIKNLKKRKVICKIGYIRSMLRLSSSKKISTFISLLLFSNCFFSLIIYLSWVITPLKSS